MYRHTTVLVLCLAIAIGAKASLAASGARADVATLKKIASRVEARAGVIAIEASDPVSYVAAQPDPQVFVIELRGVVAGGFSDQFKPDRRHPFAAVAVESDHAADGAAIARVRMTLAQPLRPRVRSARNVIYVEADRLDRMAGPATAGQRPSPEPALRTSVMSSAGPALRTPGPDAMKALAQPPSPQALQAPVAPQAPSTAQAPAAAQAPQAPAPPVVQAAGAAQGKFTGFPISLDFQGADLRAVLRTFAEISGLNVVIDPTIQGTVDVALRDVPWDQALDIILRANRLGYAVDGTIVRIAPLNVLAAEQSERQKLTEAQALAGELQTITRTLSYARADQVMPLLTAAVLSQRGSITPDVRTNTLIITDLPERLARATTLIETLDRPQPQVEIEARIVQTTRDFARQLGVQWGLAGRAVPALGNALPLGFPNSAAIGGRTTDTRGAALIQGPAGVQTGVNLPVSSATSAVGLALGAINGALNLDVAISALESQGQLKVLSTPKVATQNNVAAVIKQGAKIPIQTVANNTVTVSYQDAALVLSVTPQITSVGTVIMVIQVENAEPNFGRTVNGNPQIDTQEARTTVLVSDGETTVIGGVYKSTTTEQHDRTPGLYRVPLLGWLFKREAATDNAFELLIFITPRIVRL